MWMGCIIKPWFRSSFTAEPEATRTDQIIKKKQDFIITRGVSEGFWGRTVANAKSLSLTDVSGWDSRKCATSNGDRQATNKKSAELPGGDSAVSCFCAGKYQSDYFPLAAGFLATGAFAGLAAPVLALVDLAAPVFAFVDFGAAGFAAAVFAFVDFAAVVFAAVLFAAITISSVRIL